MIGQIEARERISQIVKQENTKMMETYQKVLQLFDESGLSYGSIHHILQMLEVEIPAAVEYAAKKMSFADIRKATIED